MLRRFNRTYTQRIGALDESFLGLGLPLGAGPAGLRDRRRPGGTTVRDLRARLGLDSGPPRPAAAPAGGRRAGHGRARPGRPRGAVGPADPAGAARCRGRLDDRSEELAARLVAPLTERQRQRLTEALATADLLVRAATVELREVAPAPRRAARAAVRQLLRASSTQRFPGGFDPGGRRGRRRTPIRARHRRRSWSRPATASRSRAAASASSSRGSARSSGCGCTPAGAGAGLGVPAAAPPRGASPPSMGHRRGPARHQRDAGRGDRDVRAGRLPPDRALQRQPLRARRSSRSDAHARCLGEAASQSVLRSAAAAPSAQALELVEVVRGARVAGGTHRHHPAAGRRVGEVPDVAGHRAAVGTRR